MGFTGVIVVTPAASRELLLEMIDDEGDDEGFDKLTGGWVSSVFYGDDVANADAEHAAQELASLSGEPVLWCSVLDSDYAMLAAAGPGCVVWTGCLEREALIESTEELLYLSGGDGDVQRYLAPVAEALPGLITWAASSGIYVDETKTVAALSAVGATAQSTFALLTEALGLASTQATFDKT